MHLDPPGTLLRCSLACLLAGGAWALIAAGIVFAGSVRLPPRVPPARIWAEWRRHRLVWAAALLLSVAGMVLTADALARAVGLRDLYWAGRGSELLWIGRLGSATGYLLGLLLLVLAGLHGRRKQDSFGSSSK